MKYVKLILGSLLVALAYNVLMISNGFISFGTDGLGFIFNYLWYCLSRFCFGLTFLSY